MARRPQPWFRKGRGWYLQRNGRQLFLARDKKSAFEQYHEIMRQPALPVSPPMPELPFVVVCDDFLDWNQRNRSPRTYAWYAASEAARITSDIAAAASSNIAASTYQSTGAAQTAWSQGAAASSCSSTVTPLCSPAAKQETVQTTIYKYT